MKNKCFSSTLSCTSKCIRFVSSMLNKKIFFGLFMVYFLGGCTAPTAMLGPAYTLTSSGNIVQASLSYGSNEMITRYTGKTPLENLQEISSVEKMKIKNIKKSTLESEDFQLLVKQRVKKTSNILKMSSQ